MNTSTSNPDEIIQTMNDEKAKLMAPAVAYIIILMVSGLIGNVMVCFYYCFKSRRNTTSVYIVTLAVYDLIVCSICMPTEIVDIELFYTFENNVACKILRFVNYFAALGSILTLVVIAVERYKKICRIAGQQITMTQSKWISLVVVLIAILLSWPSLLIYGSIKVNIPNEYNITLMGSDCTSTKDRTYRPYVWAFNIVHFVSFIVLAVALVAMYSIIGRTVFRHRNRMASYKLPRNQACSNTSSTVATTSSTNTSSTHHEMDAKDSGNLTDTEKNDLDDKEVSDTNKTDMTHCNIGRNGDKDNAIQCDSKAYECTDIQLRGCDKDPTNIKTKAECTDIQLGGCDKALTNIKTKADTAIRNSKVQEPLDKDTIKLTMMMFAVTLLFIISFLPYLSLTIWRIYVGKHEAEFLNDAGLVAFKICSRSFLLNSSLNPWIYGAFNSKFRNYFLRKLFCKSSFD